MGDCVITTSNKVLVENTTTLPSIQCIQYKASKCVPTEDDIVKSNLNGFGNAVGSITNKVTSMYEVAARFPRDSEEYKTLQYRAKCGQLYQQAEIDKIKGIKAKPMPSAWIDWFASKPDENDNEQLAAWKTFQRSIVADRKPYFFRYVYPSDNSKWISYKKDTEFKALMVFGKELGELLSSINPTDEEREFIENYYKRMPLGIAPCTINRICWKIEKTFQKEDLTAVEEFDYQLLKSNEFEYDSKKYKNLKMLYGQYKKDRRDFDKIIHSQKLDSHETHILRNNILTEFVRSTSYICPNKTELCDILLDICYEDSLTNKRFVWELCGDVIVENLLKKKDYKFEIPVQTDSDGSFVFAGKNFKMVEIDLKKCR